MKNKKDNIVLIGMPGVGKSTIGVVLAKVLGYQFIDADLVIQEQTGRLLKDIIAEDGIEEFIKTENRINASICPKNAVIATGGSVVYGRKPWNISRKSVRSFIFSWSFRRCPEDWEVSKREGLY